MGKINGNVLKKYQKRCEERKGDLKKENMSKGSRTSKQREEKRKEKVIRRRGTNERREKK